MRRLFQILAAAAVFMIVVIFTTSRNTRAMPMFSRKLGLPCSTCHTTIPRLNETGFKYRAAGLRMPDMIGREEAKKFELGDYVSGRLQARYDASQTETGAAKTTNNRLAFHEVTLYPATGAWGKYLSSLFEISFLPEEPAELENAYVRMNAGSEKNFLGGRVGIFHPFEGFGASDRPVSISRPFFQNNPTNFNQSTFFTPWGFDEAGAEVGYDYHRTSFRATLFNGLVLREEEGALKAFAAQGGPLSKSVNSPAHNSPDVQLFANQIIHPEGGALSAYYYHGNLALPIPGTEGFFRNSFDRVAFYGSYPAVKYLYVLGGFQHGRDHMALGSTFSSRGAFAEVNFPIHEYATAGFRYDWFDPATNKASNELQGFTTFVNMPLQNGLQFIAEFQHKNQNRGLLPDRIDNAFQIRFILIE
jgi:hypothetical protein